MPSKNALNVSLTEELCDFVASQVASGRYRTASEVVRAALRMLELQPADGNAAGEQKAGPDSRTDRASRSRAQRTPTNGRSL
ncbi:type II toxin-antitoxin system ParD family antitoxin [Bradyrhizobium sp. LA6.10]|uniref:type II toxin-antitoxin system ParD family antitoxin n=1 Tax=unclassified Bradyrhizobium TaxID=2631580 RepID=UPI00339210C5